MSTTRWAATSITLSATVAIPARKQQIIPGAWYTTFPPWYTTKRLQNFRGIYHKRGANCTTKSGALQRCHPIPRKGCKMYRDFPPLSGCTPKSLQCTTNLGFLRDVPQSSGAATAVHGRDSWCISTAPSHRLLRAVDASQRLSTGIVGKCGGFDSQVGRACPQAD